MVIRKILHGLIWLVAVLATYPLSGLSADDDIASKLPFAHMQGAKKFHSMCSGCHGRWGEGTDQGPPLMHAHYKPSHHDDVSFYRAVKQGVRAHHWNFGDMPAIEEVSQSDMEAIVPFLRWLQQEKGIY